MTWIFSIAMGAVAGWLAYVVVKAMDEDDPPRGDEFQHGPALCSVWVGVMVFVCIALCFVGDLA